MLLVREVLGFKRKESSDIQENKIYGKKKNQTGNLEPNHKHLKTICQIIHCHHLQITKIWSQSQC